jgi:thiol-disulfide isomerase/thioredoxin
VLLKKMSGLKFLGREAFKISKIRTKDGKPSNKELMVLSDTTGISYCQTLIPIFKQLPNSIIGCKFGMINLKNNRDVIEMSQSTVEPLTEVPYILFYVNGRPYMKFKGEDYKEASIKKFIVDTSKRVRTQKFSASQQPNPNNRVAHPQQSHTQFRQPHQEHNQFNKPQNGQYNQQQPQHEANHRMHEQEQYMGHEDETNIPGYSLGVPICGGGDGKVCYLNFDDAYDPDEKR